MEYKSAKSQSFATWAEKPENFPMVVDLEKQVRLLRHVHDLIGEVDGKILEKLLTVSRQIQEAYENGT